MTLISFTPFLPTRRHTFALIFCLLTNLAGFAQTTDKLSPDAFEKDLQTKTQYQLVDVRTPEEYGKEHLKNALNVNFNGPDFEKHLSYLDKDKPTYVYCLSGGRSAKAAARMRELGFTKVYEMQGGMLQWNNAGKPSEKAAVAGQPGMSEADFDHVLSSNSLVLVDFGAKWCAPCKKMAPTIEKLKTDLSRQVKVMTIDVDANAQLAKQKQVEALPKLILYKHKQVVWEQTGFVDEASLRQVINTHAQ